MPSTFIATLEAIAATGAKPVLVDIDPATRCMDPERLAEAVGPRTAAIVPVHLYGRPAPIDEIQAAAPDLVIVEDAAQAHGYPLRGAAAAFSFYPTKNLGALGDGGAVVCQEPEVADAVRSLRHHGCRAEDANDHVRVGATGRLDNLQAALLSVKLPRLYDWNEQRREAAALYRDALADLPLELPPEEGVFHLFAVEVDDRDQVRAALRDAGVGTAVHYPRPAHLNPAWSELGARGDYPAAERLAERTLSLPMFPGITASEIDRVAEALREALG